MGENLIARCLTSPLTLSKINTAYSLIYPLNHKSEISQSRRRPALLTSQPHSLTPSESCYILFSYFHLFFHKTFDITAVLFSSISRNNENARKAERGKCSTWNMTAGFQSFDLNPGHPSNPLHPAFRRRHSWLTQTSAPFDRALLSIAE